MATVPQIKIVVPTLKFSSSLYDDAGAYDSTDTYDGSTSVQSAPTDQVLVDVIT